MANGFRDLVERRVPQYFAIYLGAGWGLIEFMSFLEERFALSPSWTNMAMLAWLLLVPSIIIYTYNHGRPGRDQFTRFEKLAIPLNVVLLVGVLGTAFGGADLRATTTKVTIVDENGNEVTRDVAREAHRKRVAFFSFETPAGDTASAWLGEGAMIALATDLSQDIFLDMRIPAQFRKQLRDAGYGDGRPVPLAVRKKIAGELHLPYFISGEVSQGAEGVTLRLQLYDTETLEVVNERVVTEADLYTAVDEMSTLLRQDLELPAARPQGSADLPVATYLSEDIDAYRTHVQGQIAAQSDRWPEAEQYFARAAEMDPGFAGAQFSLYQSRVLQGNAQTAMPALEQAMQNLARLPERTTFLVKAEYFIMKQDMEKAYAVTGMMTDLYPDDIAGHGMRAQLQIYRNDFRGAIESYRRALELDPQQREIMLQIGELHERLGEFDEALAIYREYQSAARSDMTALLRIARTQQLLGNLDDSRNTLDGATLVDPTDSDPQVQLAMLDRNMGEFDVAQRRLETTLASADTREDSLSVLSAMAAVYEFQGQMARAIEMTERAVAIAATVEMPVLVLQRQMQSLGSYVLAGRSDDAQAILAQVRSRMTPPLDEMWRNGQLVMALEQRDSVTIREARDGVQRIIDQFGFQIMQSDVVRADAVLAELRGDWAGALQHYEELQKLVPREMNVRRDMARVYRNLNRLDDAQRMLDLHLRNVPVSPDSHMEAARIALARGDRARAREHMNRVAGVWANADASFVTLAEMRELIAAAQ